MTAQPTDIALSALQRLRMGAGLSQAEVAGHVNGYASTHGHRGAGVSANTVSRWERGRVKPGPLYRRALADLFAVSVDDLCLWQDRNPTEIPADDLEEELFMEDTQVVDDPRVLHSQDQWRTTRRALNAQRGALSRLAAQVYPPACQLAGAGLIAAPGWIPAAPVDLAQIALEHVEDAPAPVLDGTEAESAHVRPCATLTRPYGRYTQAIRDLDHPRLFENRPAWRLLGVDWQQGGRLTFGDTRFFAAVDVNEVVAHEMAYVHLGGGRSLPTAPVAMRDLPYRRLVGDPFDLARRPVMPAISTLTIRGGSKPTFLLHRRDPQSVAMAGGMLQVIPSGIFQPSSVSTPAAVAADFSLWRNIEREYAEELLGYPEHDGDGQPISYLAEPFASMDAERAAGRFRLHCLGVALDALTLVGEILTVAVIDPDVFDDLAQDFVEVNDEGSVLKGRLPFSEDIVSRVLASGRVAPAGAGCLTLAMRHRELLVQ